MINLIRGELYRYRHKKFFWITLAASLLSGIVFGVSVTGFSTGRYTDRGNFDDMFLVPAAVILCIFISLTIGREYSDGVIRNKLIQGKSRLQIYGSKLLVSIGVSLVLSMLFLIGFSIVSVKQTLPYLNGGILLRAGLAFLLMHGVWATLFTIISIVIPHKEIGSILNIALIIAVMFGCYQLEFVLGQPEFIQDTSVETIEMTPEEVAQVNAGTFEGSYAWDEDDNGVLTYYKTVENHGEKSPNPRYVSGGLRTAIELIDNTLPHGQINQYVAYLQSCLYSDDPALIETNDIPWFPLYSLGFMVVLAGSGTLAFRKKEFK